MADVAQVLTQVEDIIPALEQELIRQKNRTKIIAVDDDPSRDPDSIARAITVMGDQAIPYSLLKKIMQTCAQAGYTNISLAVEQKPEAQNAATSNTVAGGA